MNDCYIDKYIGKKKAMDILGISALTLLKLEELNKIEVIKTIGGHRKYNVLKYIKENKKESETIVKKDKIKNIEKMNICYVRVSTNGQKTDLEH
jgi:predicted site-specific integrase-resolvase